MKSAFLWFITLFIILAFCHVSNSMKRYEDEEGRMVSIDDDTQIIYYHVKCGFLRHQFPGDVNFVTKFNSESKYIDQTIINLVKCKGDLETITCVPISLAQACTWLYSIHDENVDESYICIELHEPEKSITVCNRLDSIPKMDNIHQINHEETRRRRSLESSYFFGFKKKVLSSKIQLSSDSDTEEQRGNRDFVFDEIGKCLSYLPANRLNELFKCIVYRTCEYIRIYGGLNDIPFVDGQTTCQHVKENIRFDYEIAINTKEKLVQYVNIKPPINDVEQVIAQKDLLLAYILNCVYRLGSQSPKKYEFASMYAMDMDKCPLLPSSNDTNMQHYFDYLELWIANKNNHDLNCNSEYSKIAALLRNGPSTVNNYLEYIAFAYKPNVSEFCKHSNYDKFPCVDILNYNDMIKALQHTFVFISKYSYSLSNLGSVFSYLKNIFDSKLYNDNIDNCEYSEATELFDIEAKMFKQIAKQSVKDRTESFDESKYVWNKLKEIYDNYCKHISDCARLRTIISDAVFDVLGRVTYDSVLKPVWNLIYSDANFLYGQP